MSYKLPEGFEPSTYALRMRRTADCATEASCEVLHHARPESNRIRLRTRTALHLTGLPSSLRTNFTKRTHGQRTGKQQRILIHLCLLPPADRFRKFFQDQRVHHLCHKRIRLQFQTVQHFTQYIRKIIRIRDIPNDHRTAFILRILITNRKSNHRSYPFLLKTTPYALSSIITKIIP